MAAIRNALLLACLGVLAGQAAAFGQDADAKKLGEIQAKCAEAKAGSPLRRLRVEKVEIQDKTATVSGVFLRSGIEKTAAEDIALNSDLTPICETVLGVKDLSLKLEKLTTLAPKALPHVELQAAANAAGRDEILLEPIEFDKAGKAILAARVGSAADKDWLAEAAKKLTSTKPLAGALPFDMAKVAVVEKWKLGRAPLQARLAAEGGDLARIRVERVRYEWAVIPDAEGDQLSRKVAIVGLYLDAPLKKETFPGVVEKLWPELPWETAPKLTVDSAGAIADAMEIPENDLVKALRKSIAETPALDGVRIDPKMSFDEKGQLVLAGIIPNPEAKFAESLGAAVQKFANDAGKINGRDPGLTFGKATAGGVSTGKMTLVRTDKLLSDVRDYAERELDDVLLKRLYFDADGKLTLLGKFAEPGSDKIVLQQYQALADTYLAKSDPVVVLEKFPAGFTAYLRGMIEADQKTWAGVLLERGYFTPQGAYTIRGLSDRQDQETALAKVVDDESKNARWAGYFDTAPSPVRLDLMPLAPMLARLKRVCPGYETFDHLELTGVIQHPRNGLILAADSYSRIPSDGAAETASTLLKNHPDWKRRAKPGVRIETKAAAATSDESRWLSPIFTADSLARRNRTQAELYLASATRHLPQSSSTWYLSAMYHSFIGDQELVRRDLYRVIDMEGDLVPSRDEYRNDARKRRYEMAEKIHAKERELVEAMEPWLRRAMRDGRKQISLVKDADVVLPK